MSKIASSCENCIFGKKYPEASDPGDPPEHKSRGFWASLTYPDPAYNAAFMKWDNQLIRWSKFVNGRICTRFPQEVKKHKNDFCGEHQAITFETMTEEELMAGLDKILDIRSK